MARFEDVIERDGRLVYTNVGDSMRPLIRQDRDILIIEKPHGRLKKYDVPLYKRDSGQYVLHRVLKVRPDDYVICGDNRYNKEYALSQQNNRRKMKQATRCYSIKPQECVKIISPISAISASGLR